MRTPIHYLFAALLLTLAGCDTGTQTEDAVAVGDAIAVVNGEPITEAQFQAYAERRTGTPADTLEPQIREQLVNEMVNIELLAQAAVAENLHEQPALKAQLKFQRDTALADAIMTQQLEQNPITEEDLRAEYEARQAELGGQEYKARHILVETEEQARDIIDQLEGDADFVELAKEHSIEPGAEQSGGDLGWFAPSQMVPPFAAAVTTMEPGQRSEEPVQTQFGWHVISLEDVRDVAPPAFEQVSPQIQRMLMNERIQNYINELRDNAEVTGVEPVEQPAAADETTETDAAETTPEA